MNAVNGMTMRDGGVGFGLGILGDVGDSKEYS